MIPVRVERSATSMLLANLPNAAPPRLQREFLPGHQQHRSQQYKQEAGEPVVTKPQRRGGLGRGLGALIPSAPPRPGSETSDRASETASVMSGDPENAEGRTAAPAAPAQPPSVGVKVVNRVPSLSSLSASSATDL